MRDYSYIKYVIVKYSGSWGIGTRTLYAKSSYRDLYVYDKPVIKGFSTLTIVFIIIAALAFTGIIITIVCYYCRKKNVDNTPYVSKESNEQDAIIPNNNESLNSENNINNF